jgi:hypothetical protein
MGELAGALSITPRHACNYGDSSLNLLYLSVGNAGAHATRGLLRPSRVQTRLTFILMTD